MLSEIEMEREFSRLEVLRGNLLTTRAPYQDTWEEMQHFLDPHLVIWSPASAGYPDFDDFKITSWPFQAFDDLTAGLCTGITPENQAWHSLEPEDAELKEDIDALEWCDQVNNLYRWTFENSNFFEQVAIFFRCASRFLTAAIMLEEDFSSRCKYTVFPMGSYYCSNNGQGRVDTFIFETRYKLRQIVDLFCKDNPDGSKDLSNLGNTLRVAYGDPNQWENPYNIVWAVEPNHQYNSKKAKYDPLSKKYKATYYVRDSGDKKILEQKGFDRFPIFVFRWFRQPTDAYGVDGPGRKALGDIKELFKATGLWNNAVEKVIEPPMVAPPEVGQYPMASVPGFLVTAPGASRAGDGLRPMYQIQPNLEAIQEKRMQLKQALEKTCYSDIFRMIANSDKTQPETATYWIQRIQENYNILAPVYGNFEHDWLRPMFLAMFDIFMKQGAIPPPPKSLQGKNLKWNYVSRIAQALKLVETTPYEKAWAFVAGMAQAKPNVLDVINTDEMIRRYFVASGVSAKTLNPPDQVQTVRAQRAKQMQAKQQVQNLPQIGKGVKDLTQAHATANGQ
ncbi:MAG: portal protein [Rhabdochlamydiaceae bacterium]